jgi:hypothetical protein
MRMAVIHVTSAAPFLGIRYVGAVTNIQAEFPDHMLLFHCHLYGHFISKALHSLYEE